MQRSVSLFLSLVMVLCAFAGCSPAADPADSAGDSTADIPDTSDTAVPAETEPAEETPAISSFYLDFSAPSIVVQGEVGDQVWGHYQFPQLNYTTEGNIVVSWDYGTDNTRYDGVTGLKISKDGGKTWIEDESASYVSAKNLMPNGKYFTGFTVRGSHEASYMKKYTPAVSGLYFLEDIKDDPEAKDDVTVTAAEYDPATGKTTTFECTVNWPYAPLSGSSNSVYPFTMIFALSNRTVTTVDGVMYMPLYFRGFDSFASSRSASVMPRSNKYSVYVFKSEDCGRTWDLISQVYTDRHVKNYSEGVCEPEMTVMPDGSVIMLMRTGGSNPSYLVRSTDMCKTWSDPVQFDTIGVMPQLLTLDCGVTIATYGRPSMRIRATADPTGLTWEDRITYPLIGSSCYYTDLLPLDEKTALWVYTDFGYPNPDGKAVKTVLTRTITVVEE